MDFMCCFNRQLPDVKQRYKYIGDLDNFKYTDMWIEKGAGEKANTLLTILRHFSRQFGYRSQDEKMDLHKFAPCKYAANL